MSKIKLQPPDFEWVAGIEKLREKSLLGQKSVPQGLKPDVFSIVYGTTKVVP
jgi:hypothetical protein